MKKIILGLLTISSIFTKAQTTTVIDENFDDNNNSWYESKEGTNSSEIKKGVYILENKNEKGAWFHKTLDVTPDNEDFTLECKLTQVKGVDNYGFGLVWAMYSDNSAYQTFFISSTGLFQLNNFHSQKDHKYSDWSESKAINGIKKANILKIVKTGNICAFYINGTEVYKSGDFSYFGSKFGFYINNKMEVEVDYLKITKSPKNINFIKNHADEQPKIKLSENINDPNLSEVLPVTSADEKTLFCVRKGSEESMGGVEDDDIWISTKDIKGEWTKLKPFGKPLNNTGHNFVITISPDNNTIITANTYKEDGTPNTSGASISHKTADGWEIPKDLKIKNFRNDNDYVAFFMGSDNKTLLMSVERPDGFGLKDLCVSFLQNDNTWSEPLNLGNTINTFGDETTPFLAADGKTMYFSSSGHPGLGYYDIFISKRLDDSWTNWSKPENLGESINTPSSEIGYFMGAKGDFAYVSSGGDIYRIGNPSKPEAVVLVKGQVFNSKTNEPMSANITYSDLNENKEIGNAISDPKTGEYKIVLPAGKLYSFLADKDKFYSVSENLDLKELTDYKEITKNLYLSPIEKGEIIRLNNIFFETAKAELKEESFSELDRLVKILKDNNHLKIEIGGHTDDVGSDESNLALSESRAKSVLTYLTEKGIAPDNLTSQGYGETKPLVENDTDENKATNRRVEFKILEDK